MGCKAYSSPSCNTVSLVLEQNYMQDRDGGRDALGLGVRGPRVAEAERRVGFERLLDFK